MHKRAKIVIEPNVDNNVNFCFTLGKMAADMFERHIACNWRAECIASRASMDRRNVIASTNPEHRSESKYHRMNIKLANLV